MSALGKEERLQAVVSQNARPEVTWIGCVRAMSRGSDGGQEVKAEVCR